MKGHNLIGQIFSRYTVLSFAEVKNGRTMWLCKCECGNERVVNQNNLTRGVSTSCGCSRNKPKSVAKHRLHGTPIYPIWVDIKRRCENSSRYTWKRYGGIGVKLCDEWKDITKFYKWCMDNGWKKGLCVCRNCDKGDYAPDNCYIATKSQNSKDIYIFKKQAA